MPYDLAPFANILGDPSLYFVDADGRSAPLVIENATGDPKFVIVGDALVPYDSWKAENQRPPVQQGANFAALPGKFQFEATVS